MTTREDIEKLLLGPPCLIEDLTKDKTVYDERENSLKELGITEDIYKDVPKNILIDSVEMKERQCAFSLKNGDVYVHEIVPMTDFMIKYRL